jgi:hypothetical protein
MRNLLNPFEAIPSGSILLLMISLAFLSACKKDPEPVVKENGFQQQLTQIIQQLNQKPEPPEQENGYKATFSNLPAQWTNPLKQNMETHWQSINRRGMNYFALGKAEGENQFSNRSNPDSKYYQAWVGAYVLSGKEKLFASMENSEINERMEEVLSEMAMLAQLDQKTWLFAAGDPQPLATSPSLTKTETVSKFGLNIPLYQGTINSHSDLTDRSNEISDLVGMPPTSAWGSRLDAYHDVTLSVYYLPFYDAQKQLLVVVYGASARFTDKLGKAYNYENALKAELINIMKSIELEKI